MALVALVPDVHMYTNGQLCHQPKYAGTSRKEDAGMEISAGEYRLLFVVLLDVFSRLPF